MLKSKILGIKSMDYPEGRIDSIKISEGIGTFNQLVSCLVKLGFSEKSIWAEIDGALEHRSFLFLYLDKGLRVHLCPDRSGNSFTLRIDTSLSKNNIFNALETFFELP